ncbi:hypothetical protein DEI83_11950 [Curtobacterium sp. MCBD17_021]|nr:hypothetical protein DEI83_11950 [Curtobacterium sp. MCBD17_021]
MEVFQTVCSGISLSRIGVDRQLDCLAAVVVHDEQVLVIRRFKNGRSCCVLPGGGVEESGNLREACRREPAKRPGLMRRGRAARRPRRQRCACGVLRGADDLHGCVARRTGATPSIRLQRVRPQLGRRDLAR